MVRRVLHGLRLCASLVAIATFSAADESADVVAGGSCDSVPRVETVDWVAERDAALPSHFGAVPVLGEIARYPWNHSDPDFNRKLMARQEPLVLTNSPASNWTAVRKWTPDYVAEVVGPNAQMYATHSSDGNFLFHSETKAQTADPSYSPPNKYMFMGVGDFVRMIQRNNTARGVQKRLYYKIQQKPGSEFYKLEHELQPRDMFCYDGDCAQTKLHIWFGAGGVRSLPHYDISQNFFCQIFGQKTFYLSPPGQVNNYEMLPHGHPSARHTGLEWPVQSQEVVSRTGLTLFRAKLAPGDLLLIPSLWIHTTEVEGDLPSLGFSMWNPGFSAWLNRVREIAERECMPERRDNRARNDKVQLNQYGQSVWQEAQRLAHDVFEDSTEAQRELMKFLARFRPQVCAVIGDDRSGHERNAAQTELPATVPCIESARPLLEDKAKIRDIVEFDVTENEFYGGKAPIVWAHIEGLAHGLMGERGACEFFSEFREQLEFEE